MQRLATRHAVALALVVTAILATALVMRWRTSTLEAHLVAAWPAEVLRDPALHELAVARAAHLYPRHCASCHGPDLQGRLELGAPSLNAGAWLYGEGSVEDLEQTLMYGIRSGHPKARNVTDMPAIGRSHQLSASQINDVVEYILKLNGRGHDEQAALRGQQAYFGPGNCYDCHSGDAQGNPDYGAPSLVGTRWLGGGGRSALFRDIMDGRHGICPAWLPVLGAVGVRSLAVYLHDASHPAPGSTGSRP